MLIIFLLRTLKCAEILICICFVYQNMKKPSKVRFSIKIAEIFSINLDGPICTETKTFIWVFIALGMYNFCPYQTPFTIVF